ncbi:MAG: nitrilase-related carbon-nitrogen hydrolase [Acidobacteriaceae bacterium]|jgi:apolipoprotein N-acyltransferase
MVSKPSTNALVALCLAASAALFFFGTGLTPVWMLLWLAPIPVLWLSPRLSAGHAFFVAAAAYMLGGFNIWFYMTIVAPRWVALLNACVPACLFAAVVVLFRNRVVRGRLWQAALIVPAFWVTYEYVTSLLSIHGTIGNIGYSQLNFLPILQLAAATAAMFFLCIFGYGFLRLARLPKNAPMVKVGLVASDDSNMVLAFTPEQALGMYDRFGKEIRTLQGRGIQMFVLPENSGPVTDASVAATDEKLGAMAKEAHAFVAIGVARIRPTISWNEERLYAPDGTLAATYHKHHLLPPFENQFTPAITRTTLKEPSGIWGLQICKDMDFPLLSREYAKDGVGLMVVPAWDFTLDGWSHGRIAVMRGVEGGFSIARSAKRSILYATDDRGHVLAEQNTMLLPFATVVTSVPVHHDVTLYSELGDWFAWVNIALLAILAVLWNRGKNLTLPN